jgi:hypothetical protein
LKPSHLITVIFIIGVVGFMGSLPVIPVNGETFVNYSPRTVYMYYFPSRVDKYPYGYCLGFIKGEIYDCASTPIEAENLLAYQLYSNDNTIFTTMHCDNDSVWMNQTVICRATSLEMKTYYKSLWSMIKW